MYIALVENYRLIGMLCMFFFSLPLPPTQNVTDFQSPAFLLCPCTHELPDATVKVKVSQRCLFHPEVTWKSWTDPLLMQHFRLFSLSLSEATSTQMR